MNCLKICFWNANGLSQHKEELEHFLRDKQIDVMLVSETHLTQRSLFSLRGYTLYDTKDPRGRACGGSAILIKSRLKHYLMCDYCENYLQATTICFEELVDSLVISSIYFPPRFSVSEDQYINFFKSLGPRFIVAGDFNAKHTFWGSRLISPKGRALFNTISKMGLDVVSSGEPTYWPTDRQKIPDLLDFGVTKNIASELVHVESSLDLSSDHTPVVVTISSLTREIVSPSGDLMISGNIDWLKYKKFLSTHCTESFSLRTPEEIDLSIVTLEQNLKLAAQLATKPRRNIRQYRICSVDIERLITEKRRIRREWQQYRSPLLKQQLKECTKNLRKLLITQKNAKLNSYLENLDATSRTDYSLWRATRDLKRPVIRKPPLRMENGGWARNDKEKGDLFVEHLRKVFTPNITYSSIVDLPPVIPQHRAVSLRFEIREVEKAIVDLNPKKASGIDGISNKMLLELPRIALRIILFIFNAIIRLEHFPPEWKVSQITMIPKPGKDHTKVESYRPISLLSNLSKLFERILVNKLTLSVEQNNVIPEHQFGFRRKHSTTEQVHRITSAILKTFEEKKYCSALFIDVSQAFDRVWHEGLIYKIKRLFPPNTHKLIESYITNRKFCIKEKNFLSSPQDIQAGVPQGSILGPLLYIMYTSDMPINENTLTSTFADDTAILSVNENSTTASIILQRHVLQLEGWLDKWKIKVNEQKCIHVTFTLRRETCPQIRINNQLVPQHTSVKYLGLHLDRRLTWKSHIDAKLTQTKLKLVQYTWLIGRNSKLSLDCKLLIYYSIFKPIWVYGIQLWGTASASNIERIQRCQNKILKMITGAPWYVRTSHLHRDLNVPLVKSEIIKYSANYLQKLESHPNPLARNLLNNRSHQRLRRRETADLTR